MFGSLPMAPPDAILGLTEAFNQDGRPDKINLGVGVYKDEKNKTPVLSSVKTAEKRLLEEEASKSYLPMTGMAEYGARVRSLVFGAEHPILAQGLARTAQTPGGTGALRVAADFIAKHFPDATVWLSDPTWANHAAVFEAAGVPVKGYPYYNHDSQSLEFVGMTSALRSVPEGDVVLFHGCCHNPSGMDPDEEQWETLAEIAAERGFLPLFDFAYQGFGDGLEEDAAGLLKFAEPGREMLVCTSFSKNFGLYNERTGSLTLIGADATSTDHAFSHITKAIRANYSNPPFHGAAIVNLILSDTDLRKQWATELAAMRNRINGMRQLFVDGLKAQGVEQDFSFIAKQKGMFSFSGLTKPQVARLRDEYAIYVVGSGRINVAGITPDNCDRLCAAIAAVL